MDNRGSSDAVALRSGAWLGDAPLRWIDTHAATIILTRDRAWKLKRPVRFDYLDFSTADRRREALEAELALNRPLAPGLYRQIHPITRAHDGSLRLDGDGPVVEWVLEMPRFADGALLSEIAAQRPLDPDMLTRLADRIVDFHHHAPPAAAPAGAARLAGVIAGNARAMARFPDILPAGIVAHLGERLEARASACAALLDARSDAGRIRHGHGDLHLRNIALIDGEATPFDRLEFSVELATGDVLYDLAFLVMDCWQRGLRREANLVFNRYLDRSEPDEGGASLLPLFMAVRASVRAHVGAARARQSADPAHPEEARHYLDLALACLDPAPARLVAIGGASGTGKSAVARAIACDVGPVPGARILRTDMLRKRAAGVAPEVRLPPTAYSPAANARVYAALFDAVRPALDGGHAVIADATFLDERARAGVAAVAAGGGFRFDGLWLSASVDTRIARVGARSADASDADVAVVRAQAAAGAPPGWHPLSAEGPLAGVAGAALTLLR
jgi:hypothetical protein